mmetsp:Transcript_115013/g.330391  ORF Transcript_115013/g.330391 Transcript_115013/m.330391 type:complete len:272 (-) Transcript_115013:1468-2283(-)
MKASKAFLAASIFLTSASPLSISRKRPTACAISSSERGRGRIPGKFSWMLKDTLRFFTFVLKTFPVPFAAAPAPVSLAGDPCGSPVRALSPAGLSSVAAFSPSPSASSPAAPSSVGAAPSAAEAPSAEAFALEAFALEAFAPETFAPGLGKGTSTSTVTFSSKIAVALVICTTPEESSSSFKDTNGVVRFTYLPVAASCKPSRSQFRIGLPFSRMDALRSKSTVTLTVLRARSFDPEGKISRDLNHPSSWGCVRFNGRSSKAYAWGVASVK